MPRDEWLRFQIHYQPNGKAVMDRTEIGFKFATTRVREVKSLSALNDAFAIPPNTAAHKVVATHEIKGNPWNPDPARAVRWGEQSYEEMMIRYFDFLPAPKKAGK